MEETELDISPLDSDELSKYDIYGKTPPRTKILRKNRERKQRDRHSTGPVVSSKVKDKTYVNRRNTISTMYDELIAKAETTESENYAKKSNKRQMKLIRLSDRDLKLDISSAQAFNNKYNVEEVQTPQPSFPVESYKRFMSLSCRTIPCSRRTKDKTNNSSSSKEHIPDEEYTNKDDIGGIRECPQSRMEFYQTLSLLIRMGTNSKDDRNPRRVLSREETLWQNELKDVIWLELQAFHADRTPSEEDSFLCAARESVDPLLRDIMTYRFKRHSRKYVSVNSDSGVEDDCSGCVSIFCVSCLESQNDALREVETLMKRLEEAVALFPSSKAFAELYPLYSSPEFTSRVKAISLWYNLTRAQRLKLNILGKLLLLLDNKHGQWSIICDDVTSTSSSSDSNNSTGSSTLDSSVKASDLYNIMPIIHLITVRDANNVSPYRRYIENMLKTRALNKSMHFLEKLHHNVLRRVQLTLEKPKDLELFSKNIFDTDDDELRRYGCWSPEANNLDLPSYRAMFLFLASVPLEVIHEYLVMRLEQKPENPSALSVRQLMRELKEGLRVAATERERIEGYIDSALAGYDESEAFNKQKIEALDDCMAKVFRDYLDYLEKWVLLHHNTFEKSLLEEEYSFACGVVKYIKGGRKILGRKFINILGTILKRIGERLMERIEYCLGQLPQNDDTGSVKLALLSACRELQTLFNEEREMSLKTVGFLRKIALCDYCIPEEDLLTIKDSLIGFKCIIPHAIEKVQSLFSYINSVSIDDLDRNASILRIREILMQIYRFGFEFYKEMSDGVPPEKRHQLVFSMVNFAKLWMKFVTERCDRGRGMRPRWAAQGMEFLLTVCEPANTKYLNDQEFEDFKNNMDQCISHVIGTTAPCTPDSGFSTGSPRMSLDYIRIRSRGSSPCPRPSYRSQRSAVSRKTSVEQSSPTHDLIDGVNFNTQTVKKDDLNSSIRIKLPPKTYSEHVRDAVDKLDQSMDEKLRHDNLIGKVLTCTTEIKSHIRRRHVTFSWQRGIKIGQGRFGKVYTAVNNNSGEMMAVKEISIQPNDNMTVKQVAEEMKILEGIVHKHLVKYYGVELYRDRMLLFMEFCAEGTLENLVASTENGLPEILVRRYTFQLLAGVACLHDHGVVHRDIKTANIFLTEEGNCLKIGDFGCAAKIKSHSTMPGELKGFVGTQAYMAPEVFTKNMSEGHGRAADVWSVGCVVVEMTSGKRPWHQYDSNYQIMFKVGMGESPEPPEDLIDEGLDFLDKCFKHNPKERATAHQLLYHNFVKVYDD